MSDNFIAYYNDQMTAILATMAAINQLAGNDGDVWESVGKASLATKKAWVMSQVVTVPKSGLVSGGGKSYNYATDEDMLGALRPLMGAAGLGITFTLNGIEVVTSALDRPRNDGSTYSTVTQVLRVSYLITLTCATTGYSEQVAWSADVNTALGDKAANAAIVHAEKYWLKATFAVSTGEDPDSETGYLATKPSPDHKKVTPAEAKPKPEAKLATVPIISDDQLAGLKQELSAKGKTEQNALDYINTLLAKSETQPISTLAQTPVYALLSLQTKLAAVTG